MAFATDLVIKPAVALPTTGLVPPIFPISPSNETQAYQGTAYYYSDCIGGIETMGFSNVPNQNGGYGLRYTLGGVATIPGTLAQSEVNKTIGYLFIDSTTASQSSILTTFANGASTALAVFPSGPVTISTIVFYTPTTSSAADNFTYLIGNSAGFAPEQGVVISYNRTTNSGNWQLLERSNNVSVTVTSSNVPFVPNTWHRLSIFYHLVPNQLACLLTDLSTGITRIICRGIASSYLNAGTPFVMDGVGMHIIRTTTTNKSIASLVDYWSIGIAATGRTW